MKAFVIPALSQAILVSLLHGAVILVVHKAAMWVLRDQAARKYRVACASLTLLGADFITQFFVRATAEAAPPTISVFPLPEQATGFEKIENLFATQAEMIGRVYLVGLILCCLWMTLGYLRLKNLRTAPGLLKDDNWQQQLDLLAHKLQIGRRVELLLSAKIPVPFTFGLFKPVVIVPLAMLARLSPQQMESILLHELAHIKRYDYLFNLLQQGMQNLLFFNPVAWLIGRDIQALRELCCDDLVVRHTAKPRVYASALAEVEQYRTNRLALTLSAAGEKPGSLFKRIIRMTHMKKTSATPRHKLALSLTVVAAVSALAFIIPDRKAGQQSAVKTDTLPEVVLAPVSQDSTKKPAQKKPAKKTPPEAKSKVKRYPPPVVVPDKITDEKNETPRSNGKVKRYPPPVVVPDKPVEKKVKKVKIPPPPPPAEPISKNQRAEEEAMRKKILNDPQFQKQLAHIQAGAKELQKQFDSPEWKSKMLAMQKSAAEMQKQFNSPEWKAQQKKFEEDAAEMQKKFNSAEWKAQQKKLEEDAAEMQKKFNSPEFRRKMERMKKEAQKEQAARPENTEK